MLFLSVEQDESNIEMSPEEAAIVIGVLGGLAFLFLVIQTIICVLLYGCFKRIPPDHRKMIPGIVWFMLFPPATLPLMLLLFSRWLPESYQSYFRSRGRTDVGDCGASLGLWCCVFTCGTLVGAVIPNIRFGVIGVSGIAALVLLVFFLMTMRRLKAQIVDGAVFAPPVQVA